MKQLDAELINAAWNAGTARKEDVEELVLDHRRTFRAALTQTERALDTDAPDTLFGLLDSEFGEFPQIISVAKAQCETAGRTDLILDFDQLLERWERLYDRLELLRAEHGVPAAERVRETALSNEWIAARRGDLSNAARTGYAQPGRGVVCEVPEAFGGGYDFMPLEYLQPPEVPRWDDLLTQVREYNPAREGVVLVQRRVTDGTGAWMSAFELDDQ